MKKTLILLALSVVAAVNLGCVGPCRNLFRRGSPCMGTATVAPAMIGAPRAIAAPRVRPMMMPQMMQQPACCPQTIPCEPCPNGCSQCEGMPGKYYEGAIMEGNCQSCGPVTTYDQSYLESGSELPQGAPEGSGTKDPRPAQ